ncbi:hypothetical protein MBLNU459_g1563t1 [Dothideomycetes sp. NU459]
MSKKRITEYFQPYPPPSTGAPAVKPDRRSQSVPGLSVLEGFITKVEEDELLAFLDAQKWRTDLSRRTMHYGGNYCLMPPRHATPEVCREIQQNIITAPNIPERLRFLLDRMVEHGLYTPEAVPQYCIVNEYIAGQGISAHVENFRFGEPVCSLTLCGADDMRFHELEEAHDGSVRSGKASTAPRTGRRTDVRLGRRSLVVLCGDARSKWQHEISRGRKSGKSPGWRRVSLTFRTEKRQTSQVQIQPSASMERPEAV